jgi:hypothetical protein
MKNWKTTLGGLVSGLSAVLVGIELVRQGDMEKGLPAIVGGLGLIYKGWYGADK